MKESDIRPEALLKRYLELSEQDATAQVMQYFFDRLRGYALEQGFKADEFEAVLAVKERITLCTRCQNVTEDDPCPICADPRRDTSRICVVEEPLDALAIERTYAYKGLYHVLHGVISPMNGIGPDDLKIQPLLGRLKRADVQEIILATNPNVEGEATAIYLSKLLKPLGVRCSRIAMGVPVVTTSRGASGLAIRDGAEAFIAESPEQFRTALAKLRDSCELRENVGENARRMVTQRFDWDTLASQFFDVVEPDDRTRSNH